jgi:uncharacterized membrane protein
MMATALTLHLLAAIIWVGGMFFAYVCLRPVAAVALAPAERLTLWRGVFERFFKWVWLVIAVLISGHSMIYFYGGFGVVGKHVHLMLAVGYLMILLFGHLYFAPFKRLKQHVDDKNWPEAGAQLNHIRKIVAINLTLGLVTAAIASGGKFILNG